MKDKLFEISFMAIMIIAFIGCFYWYVGYVELAKQVLIGVEVAIAIMVSIGLIIIRKERNDENS